MCSEHAQIVLLLQNSKDPDTCERVLSLPLLTVIMNNELTYLNSQAMEAVADTSIKSGHRISIPRLDNNTAKQD